MIQVNNIKNIKIVSELANNIWHECYSEILSLEQRVYMLNKFLSIEAISNDINNNMLYNLLVYNDKIVGFFAYKNEENKIFLSKLYILKEYRGKKIASKVIDYLKTMNKTISLTVNKYNLNSYHFYLHKGFIVTDSCIFDIGNNYFMDDYIMHYNIN